MKHSTLIEASAEVPVDWFLPLREDGVVCEMRGIAVPGGHFVVDICWSDDQVEPPQPRRQGRARQAWVNVWIYVYTPHFSRRRRTPGGPGEPAFGARKSDFREVRLRLKLSGIPSNLGTVVSPEGVDRSTGDVWALHCPQCDRRYRKLYIAPENPQLACRRCHKLRYLSQTRVGRQASERPTVAANLSDDLHRENLRRRLADLREESKILELELLQPELPGVSAAKLLRAFPFLDI